ncbi:regulatory protein RecX [Vibrio azureus]|uniref:Regulatory protein RecX n=1 Tax=Vibrio azureus NBRC 104587 TaxID=1219077 RepID=U3AX41_9VIBR|nr:regulatory protein RecX [Vibrio azureus]GAD77787.1 regulatory protein RecX [Vibrio azureus NBRC 104587]
MIEQELYDYAVSLLSKRDYSSGDLRYQLSTLSSDESVVDSVMEKLLSHHYVDDMRLIERELEKQLAKLHGESRIKQELRKKRLDVLLIEQALEDLDVDWFELCQTAKEKSLVGMYPQMQKKRLK